MKRILSLILVIVMVFAMSVNAEVSVTDPVGFSDMNGHWAKANVDKLVSYGVVDGFPDGSFQPQGTVTIEQFVKMVVVATGAEVRALDEGEHWSLPYLDKALELGLIESTENYRELSWNASITREWMADIAVKAEENTTPINVSASADQFALAISDIEVVSSDILDSVYKSYTAGLLQGYPTGDFKPGGYLTRAESVTVIIRLMDKGERLGFAPPTLVKDEIIENVLSTAKVDGGGKLYYRDIDDWKFYSNGWSEIYSTNEHGWSYRLNEEQTSWLTDFIANVTPIMEPGDRINLSLEAWGMNEYAIRMYLSKDIGMNDYDYFMLAFSNEDFDYTWHDSFSDDYDYWIEVNPFKGYMADREAEYMETVKMNMPDGSQIETFYDTRYYEQFKILVESLVGPAKTEPIMAYFMDALYYNQLVYRDEISQPQDMERTTRVEGYRIDFTYGSFGSMFYFTEE